MLHTGQRRWGKPIWWDHRWGTKSFRPQAPPGPLLRYVDSANPLITPEDIDHILGTRIPEEMLPNIEKDICMKLRPDVLIVKGLPAGATDFLISKDKRARATYEIQIMIIEVTTVGYCADTIYRERCQLNCHNMRSICEMRGGRCKSPTYSCLGLLVQLTKII